MIFKGFQIKYPQYTVICPQTGFTFDVRCLNVSEVSQLKASLTVPAKATALVNKMLWEAIVAKPDFIKTFDEFKRMITLRDREALLYGMYHATFGDERDFTVKCSNCGKEQQVKILLSKAFSMNAYPDSNSIKESYKFSAAIDPATSYDPEVEMAIARERIMTEDDGIYLAKKEDIVAPLPEKVQTPPVDEEGNVNKEIAEVAGLPLEIVKTSILTKRIHTELKISNVIAVIKQPTVYDEESILSSVPYAQKKQTDIINETLVIDRFEQFEVGAKRPSVIVSERDDIVYGFRQLPPMDKKKIFDEFLKEFGQYGIDLKANYDCNSCGDDNTLEIDIVSQFFRSIASS